MGKRTPIEMPPTCGLDGPAREVSAYGDSEANRSRLCRKRKKEISQLKIKFLNLPRLWKFAQGDLGGILTRGFFLNSPRLLKDFRKI
jgi:hypothetical protein